MVEKRGKNWIISGLYIFLLAVFIYFAFTPIPLASPDETIPGPIPSYLNKQTIIISVVILISSLLTALFLDKMRKKIDKYLIPDEEERRKNQKKVSKIKISPRNKPKAL